MISDKFRIKSHIDQHLVDIGSTARSVTNNIGRTAGGSPGEIGSCNMGCKSNVCIVSGTDIGREGGIGQVRFGIDSDHIVGNRPGAIIGFGGYVIGEGFNGEPGIG